MIQKVSDLKGPPVIGKFYLVECVKMNDGGKGLWLPIIGGVHTDIDILPRLTGRDGLHWHRDPRFSPKRELTPSRLGFHSPEVFELAKIIFKFPEGSITGRETRLEKRKCLRSMPEHPKHSNVSGVVEKTHVGRNVLCGKCPHKGFPLESLPKDASGHVICSGHGLKIDMKKCVVVKR